MHEEKHSGLAGLIKMDVRVIKHERVSRKQPAFETLDGRKIKEDLQRIIIWHAGLMMHV
jgi:hypothetical protein